MPAKKKRTLPDALRANLFVKGGGKAKKPAKPKPAAKKAAKPPAKKPKPKPKAKK